MALEKPEGTGPGRPTKDIELQYMHTVMLNTARQIDVLNDSLKKTSKKFEDFSKVFEQKVIKKINEADSTKKESEGKRNKRDPFSFSKLYDTFRSINIGFTGLVTKFGFAVHAADEYQRLLLKNGTSLGSFLGKYSDTVSNIPADFQSAMEVTLEDFDTGAKTVSKNLLLLAAREKLTGGNSAALIKSLRETNVAIGGNSEELDTFTLQLFKSTAVYKQSAEKIANAIESLKPQLRDFAVLGQGGKLKTVIADLMNQLGATNEELITSFMREFADPSEEARKRAALLGITSERQEFFRNPSAEIALAAITKAAANVQSLLNNTMGSNADISLDLTKRMFGELGQISVILNKNLGDINSTLRESLSQELDFNKSIVGYRKLFEQFVDWTVTQGYPWVIDTLYQLKDAIVTMTTLLAVGGAFKGLHEFATRTFPTMVNLLKVTGVLASLGTKMFGVWGLIITGLISLIPSLVKWLFPNLIQTNKDILKSINDQNKDKELKEAKRAASVIDGIRLQALAQEQILDSIRTIELTKTIQEMTGKNTKETVVTLKEILKYIKKDSLGPMPNTRPGLSNP